MHGSPNPRPGRLPKLAALALVAAVSILLAACGDGGGSGDSSARFETLVGGAQDVKAADFPRVRGRTLQQIADSLEGGPQLALATSVFVPGRNRIAFGVLDANNRLVYAPSALYLARSPKDVAEGPVPAPADSLIVEPRFRSRNAAAELDTAGIFSANVRLTRPGRYVVLVATKLGRRLLGAGTGITVRRSDPIPAPGEQPPPVDTETIASTGATPDLLETRVPPDGMHRVSFEDVLGERPVALLFATPQLCKSRVCGPVTDIAEQVRHTYGDRVAFIHQEVYVDNEVNKGFRPPLRAFNLRTEPWLFTFDRSGRVAARLEGSFGVNEFTRAVEAALRRRGT